MILIHSNVSKYFQKQYTSTLYCFRNRRRLDGKSNNIDDLLKKKKKIVVVRFIGKLFPLITIEDQLEACIKINRDDFLKSYK